MRLVLCGSLKQPHDRATKVLPARARPLERLRDELMRSRSPSGDTRRRCRVACPLSRKRCPSGATGVKVCALTPILAVLSAGSGDFVEGGKRALNCGFRVLRCRFEGWRVKRREKLFDLRVSLRRVQKNFFGRVDATAHRRSKSGGSSMTSHARFHPPMLSDSGFKQNGKGLTVGRCAMSKTLDVSKTRRTCAKIRQG